jgi:hypothetical protein
VGRDREDGRRQDRQVIRVPDDGDRIGDGIREASRFLVQ